MPNKEMNLFKDEVLKKIRELETKFFKELSKKSFDISINYENFSEKVSSILESNRLMIESMTNQKLHLEKIKVLETNKKEIEDKLMTHEIKINNSLNEIKKMRFNYDKIISENLIIPAYIGPGSMYKSLGEFIISSIEEFKKFKEEKENIKNLNNQLKVKIDVMSKNLTNFVEFNSSRCKAYTDSKEKEYQLKLDDKFKIFDEKTLETNQHIYSNQIKFEEKLKEMGDKISEISKIKNKQEKPEINLLLFDKFEEIKKKEEEMNKKLEKAIKEVKELKLMKKELKEQMKNIILKIDYLNNNSKVDFSYQELYNMNKKTNLNSFGNIFYNTNNNNNITNLNEQKNKSQSKKNDLPNLSQLMNPFMTNKIDIKNNIYRNEKLNSKYLYDSKTEEDNKQNIMDIKKEEKNLNVNDNTFRKSVTNLLTDANIKENEQKIFTPRNENTFLSTKLTNYNNKIKIKEKIYEKSTKNLKLNSKDSSKKIIYEKKLKEDNIDKQNNINFESKKIIKNNYEKLGKTSLDFYKKFQTNHEGVIKPFATTHKKKHNILVQTNKIGNNYNRLKDEFRDDVNYDENDNYTSIKNILNTEGNINAVECNVVNLNLLDLPKNKSNVPSLNDYIEKSFDLKNQNKKKNIKSVDSKRQIKVAQIFGKTTYIFYNKKENGKINSNGNLYNNDNEYHK